MGERVDPDSGAANAEGFRQGREGRETCDSCRNPGAGNRSLFLRSLVAILAFKLNHYRRNVNRGSGPPSLSSCFINIVLSHAPYPLFIQAGARQRTRLPSASFLSSLRVRQSQWQKKILPMPIRCSRSLAVRTCSHFPNARSLLTVCRWELRYSLQGN
jgi:hypothetical protein